MRLNSRGQVTIPAELRRKYDLRPGDEMEVFERDGVLHVCKAGEGTRDQSLRTFMPNLLAGEASPPTAAEVMARLDVEATASIATADVLAAIDEEGRPGG